MFHSFFIHSSVDGHLGWFQVLAIINNVSMYFGDMCLFKFLFPQGICLVVGLLSHMMILFLDIKESPYCLLEWLYQFTFSPTVLEGSFFSIPVPAFAICRLFDDGYSDQYEVVSHYSLDLHFYQIEGCWASFHVFASHLHAFFGEMSV